MTTYLYLDLEVKGIEAYYRSIVLPQLIGSSVCGVHPDVRQRGVPAVYATDAGEDPHEQDRNRVP